MIDVIRLGHADSPHGRWIAGWVKEQLLQDHPELDIRLVPVTDSLTEFALPNVILDALEETELVVVDGSFVPAVDDSGVVVAAVCERADPRHCLIGDGSSITVWHPSLSAVLSVTDPSTNVTFAPTLIDAFVDDISPLDKTSSTIMLPSHAVARTQGQRLGQTPVEAEDILSACCQGATFVYAKQCDTELGSMVFSVLNAMDTRREVTVERYFKAQLDHRFHDSVCCYSAGSDRFLYLFVTFVVDNKLYKTRSGAHISALGSIVEQGLDDLEKQVGQVLRARSSTNV